MVMRQALIPGKRFRSVKSYSNEMHKLYISVVESIFTYINLLINPSAGALEQKRQ